jgi:hypothetical protein
MDDDTQSSRAHLFLLLSITGGRKYQEKGGVFSLVACLVFVGFLFFLFHHFDRLESPFAHFSIKFLFVVYQYGSGEEEWGKTM